MSEPRAVSTSVRGAGVRRQSQGARRQIRPVARCGHMGATGTVPLTTALTGLTVLAGGRPPRERGVSAQSWCLWPQKGVGVGTPSPHRRARHRVLSSTGCTSCARWEKTPSQALVPSSDGVRVSGCPEGRP